MKSCKMHNVCLNQGVSEYLPKTSLFPKKMHETTLKNSKEKVSETGQNALASQHQT